MPQRYALGYSYRLHQTPQCVPHATTRVARRTRRARTSSATRGMPRAACGCLIAYKCEQLRKARDRMVNKDYPDRHGGRLSGAAVSAAT